MRRARPGGKTIPASSVYSRFCPQQTCLGDLQQVLRSNTRILLVWPLMVSVWQENTGSNLAVDAFGGGADLPDVEASSSSKGLSIKFHGPKDHLSPEVHEYKVEPPPHSSADNEAIGSARSMFSSRGWFSFDLSLPSCSQRGVDVLSLR